MCTYWTVKYLCGCIWEEHYIPCELYGEPHKHYNIWCYWKDFMHTHDVLTLCEECYGILDKRIRKYGVKKVLALSEKFPLAEKLGMLLVLISDENVRWGLFRGKKQVLLREVEIEPLEVPGPLTMKQTKRLGGRRPRRKNGTAWKYK